VGAWLAEVVDRALSWALFIAEERKGWEKVFQPRLPGKLYFLLPLTLMLYLCRLPTSGLVA